MFEQLIGNPNRVFPRELEELTDHSKVLATGQIFIDGCVLASKANAGSDLVCIFHDIESVHSSPTIVWDKRRCENSYRCGLASTIRP
ncbi:unannotated protein [freshwater metagenome]|uniref:Unannotated protein n=1 Tax=freshwater metagenome TaxID=449393 RepID=A0A6J7P0L5_9ZZZZ